MKRTRLVVVGGFLGAGKTTAIAELAKRMTDAGTTVGVVTNDQGRRLVDTEFLTRFGYSVLEVTGGCFCCNFDQLTARLAELGERNAPDVVLAEPVGSCTDLVATIFRPLLRDYPDRYALAPLSVLAEPERASRYLKQRSRPLTTEVNFLFETQLTESDLIILSKSDTLDDSRRAYLRDGLTAAFPGRELLPVSSESGEGLDRWLQIIVGGEPSLRDLVIDYETYAEAEAALGWLNASATFRPPEPESPNGVVEVLLTRLTDSLQSADAEIAHIKAYAMGGLDFARASVTHAESGIQFTKQSSNTASEISILVNARVQIGPERLEDFVRAAFEALGKSISDMRIDSFTPAAPRPTHRLEGK